MTKIFKGFCFKCEKKSDNRDEFHTRGLCILCHNDYFKSYMKKYNKENYRYRSKWQQIIVTQLSINV
jgi:hypothetical protein